MLDCCHIKSDLNDDAKIHVLKHINGMFAVKNLVKCNYLTICKSEYEVYVAVYKVFTAIKSL